MNTAANSSVQFHIPSLDGLRAVAIMIVFASHAGLKMVPGGLGVTIFFFISGFLITSLLRREYQNTGLIHLRYFYFRRILRIWPAFYLVLFAGAALTMLNLLPGELRLSAFLSQVFHVVNYYSIHHGTNGLVAGSGVYWSLAVEEHFYLLLPLLYWSMLRLGLSPVRQQQVFLFLCLGALVWRLVLVNGEGFIEDRTYYASDTRYDSLLFGCALAVYGNPAMDRQVISRRLLNLVLVPLGLVLLMFSLIYRNPEFRESYRYTVQGIALIPIFIAAIRYPDCAGFRWLNWKWVSYAGTLSYSLYLVHLTVIKAVEWYLPAYSPVPRAGVALILSLFLSWTIYRYIESPFGKLRKKFKFA